MKNWKTTLGGIVGTVGTFLSSTSSYHVYGVALSAFAMAWLGYHAQDQSK